jgi:hypothetical protein
MGLNVIVPAKGCPPSEDLRSHSKRQSVAPLHVLNYAVSNSDHIASERMIHEQCIWKCAVIRHIYNVCIYLETLRKAT